MKSFRGSLSLSATLLSFALAGTIQAQPPAFPGADGAGQFASGGRGGIVYHVTKLNLAIDDPQRNDPGTFLYGLNDANFTNHPTGTPRTIVFDVAGVLHLGRLDQTNWTSNGNAWDAQSRQSISSDNITIAGQTAPGPVIIMGGTLKLAGSNLILRNFTVAPGYGVRNFWGPGDPPPSPGTVPVGYTMRALDISGQNMMIDHVSTFYSSTVTIECDPSADNLTLQYCNNSKGQNHADHIFGYVLQGDTDHTISVLNNLAAHQAKGLPYVGSESGTGAQNGFRNNVFYNWIGTSGGYAGYAPGWLAKYTKDNFIQNFYLTGNGGDISSSNSAPGGLWTFYGYQSYGNPVGPNYTSVYPFGNLMDSNMDGDPNDGVPNDGGYVDCVIKTAAYDVNIGLTLSAQAAFTNVLRHVGPRWWERDYDFTLGNTNAIDTIDERIIHEVVTGTGRVEAWADDPFDTNALEGTEWRSLWALRMDTNGVAPFNRPAGWDTDGDGMPDTWETEHGLDLNVANNNSDFDDDLYTDLEEYLNEIAAWPAPGTIYFTGENDNRYAPIFNWRVYGVNVNISGIGNLPTSSQWQPSRYDTAVITNQTVVVDAAGQHAGELKLMSSAVLNVTNGWLKVATRFENGAGCTTTVSGPGTLTTSNLLNAGTLRLTGAAGLNVSGTFTNTGTLDIMSWNGTLPGGLVNLGTILDGSLIVITDYEVSGADVLVTIQGYTGHNYQLQFRDGLTSGSWQNVDSSVAGANAPIQFTHPNGAGSQQRLYRVVVD